MKEKKLNNFEDLKKIKFENLSPDPDPEIIQANKTSLNKQCLEAHFSSKGRAGKIVTVIKGFEGSINEVKTIEKKTMIFAVFDPKPFPIAGLKAE